MPNGQGATTGDAINHLVDKVSNSLDTLTHAIASKAPVAWQLLVNKAHFEGVFSLYILGCCVFLFFLSLGTCLWCGWQQSVYDRKKDRYSAPDWCYFIIFSVFSGLATIVFLVASCAIAFDTSVWMRIYYPEGYVAQQLLDAVR